MNSVMVVRVGGNWYFGLDAPKGRTVEAVRSIRVPAGSEFIEQKNTMEAWMHGGEHRHAISLAHPDEMGREFIADAATLIEMAEKQLWPGAMIAEAEFIGA